MPSFRCFLAVDVSEGTREAAMRLQNRFRAANASVSYPSPERLHLTLEFLGDTPAERCSELAAAVDHAAATVPPFDFRVAGIGLFGSPRHPRVIWAGVDPASPPLLFLQKTLHSSMKELRFTFEDRPYVPHLTLGRIRAGRGLGDLTRLVDSLKGEPLGLNRVERVLLMRSHLDEPGGRHTVLHETPLQGD